MWGLTHKGIVFHLLPGGCQTLHLSQLQPAYNFNLVLGHGCLRPKMTWVDLSLLHQWTSPHNLMKPVPLSHWLNHKPRSPVVGTTFEFELSHFMTPVVSMKLPPHPQGLSVDICLWLPFLPGNASVTSATRFLTSVLLWNSKWFWLKSMDRKNMYLLSYPPLASVSLPLPTSLSVTWACQSNVSKGSEEWQGEMKRRKCQFEFKKYDTNVHQDLALRKLHDNIYVSCTTKYRVERERKYDVCAYIYIRI